MNETRLVAAVLPGCATASVAAALGPSGLPRRHGLPGVSSTAMNAWRQLTTMISSCSLVEGEGMGSLAEDSIGAVVEGVERGTMLPRRWELARQLATQITSGQRKRRSIQRF